MPIAPAPARSLAVLTLAGLAACSPDPSPRGYHSPSVAWASNELGLVWLDRQAAVERVVFARAREDAKLIGATVELSRAAWHSDPPLVASDGRGYMVAWTQAGGRPPALMTRAIGPGGPEGPARAIVESSVHACPQLVWIGDAYAVGWREGGEIYLGRIGTHGVLAEAPLRIAETDEDIAGCRVAWSGDELGVLWWSPAGDDARALALARVSPDGTLRELVEVHAAAPASEPIDLAWHDDAWVVASTSPGRTGAATVRVHPGGDQTSGPALTRDGWVRGLSLSARDWLGAAWVEGGKPGAPLGRVYFDLLGRTGDPLPLATNGRARPHVSTSAQPRRAAATWSSMAGTQTSVHWAVIRLGTADAAASTVVTGALDRDQ